MFDPNSLSVSMPTPNSLELETPLDAERTPTPPDSEELFEQSSHLYEMAQKYWNSTQGQKRSLTYDFNGRTTQDRESLLAEKFDVLKSPSTDDQEIDPETLVEKSRDQLILETHEFLIEQILSDMVEATKQQVVISNKINALNSTLSSEDLNQLIETSDELELLSRSLTDLDIYLAAAKEGVKNYELHARETGKSAKFFTFMKDLLGEYRKQAGRSFDERQEDKLQETFGWQADLLKGDVRVQQLLGELKDRIERLQAGEKEVEGIVAEEREVEPDEQKEDVLPPDMSESVTGAEAQVAQDQQPDLQDAPVDSIEIEDADITDPELELRHEDLPSQQPLTDGAGEASADTIEPVTPPDNELLDDTHAKRIT